MNYINRQKYIPLYSLFSAFIATIGFIKELSNFVHTAFIQGDILLLAICFIWYFFYKNIYATKKTLRFYNFTITISFLLSASLVSGIYLNSARLNYIPIIFAKTLSLTSFIYPLVFFATTRIDDIKEHTQTFSILSTVQVLICFSLILIVWGIGWLTLFPGVYGIDAPTWYEMWNNTKIPISSHWSVLISGLFYLFTHFGISYFKSAEIGFAMYSLLQMCFVLWTVYQIISFLNTRFGYKAVFISTAFFCVIPTHLILAVSSAQDAPFSACFAMCCIELYKLCENSDEYWADRRNTVHFIFWACLMCIIRNNGLYALWVTALLYFFCLKFKSQKRVFKNILIVSLIILFYQGPIYQICNIQKGTALREMLSIPLQQMAAAYNYNESLPDDLRKQMEDYWTSESLHQYTSGISDPIKNNFDVSNFQNDPIKFLKLYLNIGQASFPYYIKSTLLQTYGLWYLNKTYPDDQIWHPYINYICIDASQIWGENALDIHRYSFFPKYEHFLQKLFGYGNEKSGYGGNLETEFVNIPIFSSLCKLATYFWLVLYIAGYGFYKKQDKTNLVILFALGLTVTVFLSPLMYYRYYAPIIFSTPIIIASLFQKTYNV